MALPKKVLLAITSNNDVFYDDGAKSGLYWSEAAHPYHVFTKAGFEVQFASETGSYGIDEHSVSEAPFISDEDLAEYKDKSAPVHKALANVKKASELKAKDFGIFFAAGGHAALLDFPTARDLQSLAEDIYSQGGVVSAVCHGPAILEGIKDKATGELLIKGKKVTGFTDLGETQMGLDNAISSRNLKTLEHVYKRVGATYSPPPNPFDEYAVTDGRVVTGPNPASAAVTAQEAIKAFGA